ncbi:hypothetical protein NEMIN01_0963 [Nematocida minor]|uniref:uncharacterized protein n=1 Tax=Nematocida minor TaxID=1912983 RepID=UPI0022202FE1|nr:uncharacterized protein NEMIN01_0963 [Nematocida minor]KAI5190264.1 hypothetical protein NEMIN01_0963 [Nematocida minor]
MEGETYGSISRASESGIISKKSVEFLHGRRAEEGLFRVVIERRMTRTKYLIRDVSGKGILNLDNVPGDIVTRIVKKEDAEKKPQLLVIGRLLSPDVQEFPVLDAYSISLFTYESALRHIL